MVDFLYKPGRQSDLVSVRTVSVRRLTDQFLLGQLALKRILHGNSRVCGPGYAHCLINIGPS